MRYIKYSYRYSQRRQEGTHK